ncbi:MAG TPA: PEGA domain-containing protein [Planctomycetota bacterium]|nr:PEGA domain-containing protein [Planctomycetota bacterium]
MTRHVTMAMLAVSVVLLAAAGCVERKLIITSDPPGARVYVDDEEVGQTPVSTRFDFYGGRTFVLKKDGYRDTMEVRKVRKPFYAQPVLDIITDLGPIPIKDHQSFHFKMEPMQPVDADALIERAREMRSRVTGEPYVPKAPAPAEPAEPATPDTGETKPPAESPEKPAEPPPGTPAETPAEMTPGADTPAGP